ncbi:phosphoenolpyruvate--protein phosphotransferase [Archangium gephyra]|uniref:Phosphoenolpyruvate-protein phosphotransferase n=1 Tax=Archangium gephyra TaxID=48 RepID=A0AAC8QHH2_9BACT|nr:phosphoenolpyruvate--protein phosphotransferase [Archangium gephyra]AKJ07600.1 Phosphoenolpyruvate-protein phosphotransferase of PTS system [Archangium gephyra]REG29356.1 phosphoenolpyruvate--protein phosphotransferase [Archangium gephyra]
MSSQATPTLSLKGIGASPGVAVGHAYILDRKRVRTPKLRLAEAEVDPERMRMKTALDLSDRQLSELKEQITRSEGPEHGLILEAHRLMLHDPMFVDEVNRLIVEDRINAEWAVRRVARKLKHLFDNIPDEYFRERRSDVEYVADRVVRNLMGQVVDEEVSLPDHAVVVAHDLSPADTAMMARSGRVAGFVTDLGGQTSHTAIVARARSIPAVVGAGRASEQISPGDLVALDGTRGLVLVNPTEDQLKLFHETMRRHQEIEARALEAKDLPAQSTDGFRMRLVGNIEFPEEIPSLLAHGAEGIGLYRTEFMFLDRKSPPTEEEQYRAYRQVLEAMGGRPVTIRTLDLGGDKVPGKTKHEKEPNPAMGLRAIRYCLANRELFRVQLRALLRASVHGHMRMMFPLICGMSELREARSELEACRTELGRAGVPLGKRFQVGIMVETPSAALIADRLAQEADFFSVGTNDLIQYSLAIDRQNRDVAYLYKPLHLSVLRSLKNIVSAAKGAGIPVAMCGEMAGDPIYALVLLALGFDELSMTAGQIPTVKGIIRESNRADAQQLLETAMELTTAEEIERFIRTEMERRLGEQQ